MASLWQAQGFPGVVRRTDAGPNVAELLAPTDEALPSLLHKIITRTTQAAHAAGAGVEAQGSTCRADNDGEPPLGSELQARACAQASQRAGLPALSPAAVRVFR